MPSPIPESARSRPVGLDELREALPQYEFLSLLGSGGMGAVYRARQRSLNREVAVKVVRSGEPDDFNLPARFCAEARAMARMNHPAIVHVHDFGESPAGFLYIVMEYVAGTDLQRVLQERGRLEPPQAAAMAATICEALAYAHAQAVIHRDIKPGNVLVAVEGQVKVADFGIAKMIDPAQTSVLTATNLSLGTPNYAAPEAATPGATVDHRADIFAVGVLLYQMLTGAVPRGIFKLPSQKVGCDARFDSIVVKSMEADPAERFQSAGEMGRALEAIRDSLGTKQRARPSRWRMGALGAAGLLVLLALVVIPMARKQHLPAAATAPAHPGQRNDIPSAVTQPTPAAISAPAARAEPKPVDWLKLTRWQAPYRVAAGVVTAAQEGDEAQKLESFADGVIRLRVRDTAPLGSRGHRPPLQVTVRYMRTEGSGLRQSYVFQIYPHQRTCTLLYFEVDRSSGLSKPTELWHGKMYSAHPEEEQELELHAVGDELSLWHSGACVASVHDSRLPSGSSQISMHSGIELTRLEFTPLSSAPAPAATAPTEAFLREVAAAAPERQVELITEKLREVNTPQLKVEPTIRNGSVTILTLRSTDRIADLSPIAALSHLQTLRVYNSCVSDLTPLAGLPLTALEIIGGGIRDLSALKAMPLETLTLRDQPFADLSALKGRSLQQIDFYNCKNVADLGWAAGMPLTHASLVGTKIRDLTPLRGAPLEGIWIAEDLPVDPAFLRSFPTLRKINSRPADEFLERTPTAP